MTLDEIKQLIEFIKGHDLSEFELEHDGVKIRVKSGGNHHQVMPVPHMAATMPMMAAQMRRSPRPSAPRRRQHPRRPTTKAASWRS